MKLLAHIPKRIWAPGLVLLLVSGVVSSALQAELPLAQTRSSYGALPQAWGAAYDLLAELGLGPTRSREKLARRTPASTQWLIEPAWSAPELAHELASVRQFVRAGGTLLLIGASPDVWRELGADPTTPPRPGFARARNRASRPAPTAAADARAEAGMETLETREVVGPRPGKKRKLELAAQRLFDAATPGFEPRVRSEGHAVVLEQVLGKGRLVLVAGSDFLTNERLDRAENARFLVDLQRVYGAPVFDERCHGLTPERSSWAVLGVGFVVLAGLSLSLLAAAALLSARRWPLPAEAPDALPPPTLEVFVGSLSSLYRARGRREPGAVFRAYRVGFLRRLQRLLYGQREISQAAFEARVARDAAASSAAGSWLHSDATPRSSAELLEAVTALERYAAATHPERHS